jgi:gamma-glutamyltranspeptidase
LELAHARFGKVPWSVVIEPARKMAEEGVIVSSYFAHAINLVSSKKKIFKSPELTKLLTKNHTGTVLLDEGDLFTQPALANTFKLIMDAGSSDVIYKGPIAQTIAADIKKAWGIITAEQDLANYRATLYDPLIARDVGGFTMIGIPPPSSGGSVVLGALRFLAGYKEPLVTFSDTLSQHRMVEATKHAYAVRMWLSDPAYNSAVVKDAVNDLVYTNYMHYLR